jgi:type I protein arginine methyltransferase
VRFEIRENPVLFNDFAVRVPQTSVITRWINPGYRNLIDFNPAQVASSTHFSLSYITEYITYCCDSILFGSVPKKGNSTSFRLPFSIVLIGYVYRIIFHLLLTPSVLLLRIPYRISALAALSFGTSHSLQQRLIKWNPVLPDQRFDSYRTMSTMDNAAPFVNVTDSGDIPSFNGDEKSKATDYANYFCSYAQLYHQKQMLCDHNRMAAYHSAILGNRDVFKDKVVMDIGTGSGILAVWAAQAGARKVYAIEYTDMAHHAKKVMVANQVDHIVTVIQSAVEEVELPMEKDELVAEPNDDGTDSMRCVDIIISEWMGYFLLRESMLDSIIRARDKFLKRRTGLLLPSHCSMYVAPVTDEKERKQNGSEYAAAMSDWYDFAETTSQTYGVDMNILEADYDREQKDYYMLSSRWTELTPETVLAEPVRIKHLDMMTCTLQDSRGIGPDEAPFDFDIKGDEVRGSPVSGIAGWFTSDFGSRTDAAGIDAPKLLHPAFLSTGPENGYTHWGQQTFYFLSSIPVLKGETVRLQGTIQMIRTKANSRLYNCLISYETSRRRTEEDRENGQILMKSHIIEQMYQIP